MRIGSLENQGPTRAQKRGHRWTLVNVFVRGLAHYYSPMENTVYGMNKKPPGLSHRPATWVSVCFLLSTWQRCGLHMRLEVWQPDLQLMFRDLGNSLSNCPRIHHFKRRSRPRASSALRSLYKQIGYARPQWCSCAIRCFVTGIITFVPGRMS
jgi:hypothetical protein